MKLTIGKKLIGSFLLIALLLGVTSGISYYYLTKVDESYSDIVDRRAIILANAQKIQVQAASQSNSLRGYLLTRDTEFLETLRTYHENLNDLINQTLPLVTRADHKEKLKELEKLNREFKQKYDQVIQMAQNNQDQKEILQFLENEVLPAGRIIGPSADVIAFDQQKIMEEESKANSERVHIAVANVAIISSTAFILAILIGFFISRHISKPLVSMAKVAEQIASGDLTADDIHVKNRDEIGDLAKSFSQMAFNLRNLIRQVSVSAEQVAAASEELTASAEQTTQATENITNIIQEVAAGSEQQNQSIEESLQAMNEMSSGVQQIAANAQMTSSLSAQASEKALEGNQAIQAAEQQMDSIHLTIDQLADAVKGMGERSNEIEQIVETISAIAAQTNLLALNAAIEAARAGEHGRGFAVVADEVRKLAEQSAQSSQQIAQLIANIQMDTNKAVQSMEAGTKEVVEGIQLVHTAGKLFEEIKNYVDRVAGQIEEVSAASEQMSAGTEQVVRSVDLIAELSQTVVSGTQNVSASAQEQLASMEEIASSATSLSKMAGALQQVVGKFRV